jgi:general secretion pathway protein D
VKERIDIGGISQPVVGQRRVVHDIRLREGEVNLLGGLVQEQESKGVSGVPGLSSIPVVRRLFTSENVTKTESELLIALVPRIVRTPEFDDLSYKGIASGNLNTVRLNYAPRQQAPSAPAAATPEAVTPAAPAVIPAPPAAKPEAPSPQPPPAASRVVLSPEKIETLSGATFTVNLQVENVNDLFSAPVRLKFDPNVLRLNEVARGSFLSADGKEVLFTRNILNETGDASIVLSRMPGSVGVSGSGSLVTLTFQVVGKGSTVITAPQLSFQDSRASTIVTASPQVTVAIK